MRELYNTCLETLRGSGLTEAACREGRFFRFTREKTAFILNLRVVEDVFLEIVFGFTSTAWFALGPGEKEFFLKEGGRSDDITLRRCIDILSEADLPRADAQIREFYEAYREMDKDALLEEVKALRKAFLSQVGALLKPHKFRKKGNTWTKDLENGLFLEFHAQKSGFSDEYYFNIRCAPAGRAAYPGCFHTRLASGGGELFDWQLSERTVLLNILEKGIEQKLLPFLTVPPADLGRESWVWESCTCKRTCCENCWVAKNIWESRNTQ